ncbi:hypothetical protein NDU88_007195 [Pleurodeles waltl]|uniref:Uncharacterized protein n=1 Tax=Pleurodeles waltl TaxID=8319 RepID=A0AAV7WGY9_PLEWA|nr:hypothetical protein NDU88_007195 [Pleurodeles waltl]
MGAPVMLCDLDRFLERQRAFQDGDRKFVAVGLLSESEPVWRTTGDPGMSQTQTSIGEEELLWNSKQLREGEANRSLARSLAVWRV